MSTYAIGDIQGCFKPLQRLVADLRFDPARDRLWLVGDLVNRGPDSLAVLRWAKGLGVAAVTVLGNHDLHLLALDAGVSEPRRGDTLDDILSAPDRRALLDWLRERPLIHQEDGHVLVHAGLLPQWSTDEAVALAEEVRRQLRSDPATLLRALYASREGAAVPGDLGRLTTALAAFTRLRACTVAGQPDYGYNGPLEKLPANLCPWFAVPGRRSADTTVICGHWAALGFRMEPHLIALDSGCVWGRALTAVRLEDRQVFTVPCPQTAG
ncbi:MAG TPA: symmetrical bis(5'-nucleosyl)-tetraphosphatase [Nitrospirales bacterium]|nr:symmetrical bis(5'-nucleosyl)-tetraphosphatase [Nitrospirales bacterium]